MAVRAPSNRLNIGHGGGLGIRDHVREERRKRVAEATGSALTMAEWARLVPERGIVLSFDEFPFQREWFSEEIANAREVVWQKAAQVGMSSYAWRWAARRAEQFSDRVIYFFPTDDDVSEFGDSRIEPSIQDSEFLLRRIKPESVRHKHLKQIGGGWLALRGTQSKSSVQSVDADALVFDEYDYLNQKNLAQAERRVAGAVAAGREPRIRRFGYPTLAGYGINTLYSRSDRRVWFVTCPECGDEQPLRWDENVRWRTEEGGEVCRAGHDDYEDYLAVAEVWRACRSCEHSFETPRGVPGPIHAGRWKATNPGAEIIGFQVSRLVVPRTDLRELVRNSRKTSAHDQEALWNNDLGEPFSPSEAALTPEQIEAACSLGDPEERAKAGRRDVVIGGLDVASERDMTIWIDRLLPDGKLKALYLGEPADFEEVTRIMDLYRVQLLVVDGMPERRSARTLAATYPGRVVLAAYDDRNDSDAFKYNPEKNMVTINRTEAIDAFMDGIRHQTRLPLRKPPRKFQSQLLSPKRRTEEDARGRPRRVYVSTGPDGDDFTHAGVYGLVAKELWVLRQQVEIEMGAQQGEQYGGTERLGFGRDDEYRPGFG